MACDFADLVQNGFCTRPVAPLQGSFGSRSCTSPAVSRLNIHPPNRSSILYIYRKLAVGLHDHLLVVLRLEATAGEVRLDGILPVPPINEDDELNAARAEQRRARPAPYGP
jgi:hypothetical protein